MSEKRLVELYLQIEACSIRVGAPLAFAAWIGFAIWLHGHPESAALVLRHAGQGFVFANGVALLALAAHRVVGTLFRRTQSDGGSFDGVPKHLLVIYLGLRLVGLACVATAVVLALAMVVSLRF